METLHERFLNHLAARGWIIQPPAGNMPASPPSPAGNVAHAAFLSCFEQLHNQDGTCWFLCAADYAGTSDSAFGPDVLRDISLESAISEVDRQTAESFWKHHIPIFMSVNGDYQFLALDRISGRVVHGAEPEFEEVTEVADSLDGLFEQVLMGGKGAGLFD
ncbi:hypothetical protein [Kerstersia gyiorum]|uniref:hypothetical protein n=1 Tax=Kerstersia gyiorum TaxID=206506 RepID=UPI00209CE43F|nr:hypothetical protein [Kerstersia gyiorum]MCP1634232.1 hypothetical protein [Kerstersia gyiorum]MCP1638150.1 hypothetical protein [Kerstersia gyiorum]MCP1672740.1 hypothetical protein [Kerstersia gyiorum]MCP1680034.1 hypothetical protein [Kerstersia gyiorum]MCP1683616.1 hypothetical protein [Kerstersia gyiorum]